MHSDYSLEIQQQYIASGCEVSSTQNLGLKEIFIQQVTHRRKNILRKGEQF